MLQRLRHRAQGQEGFTLIELLVVILIIGILAAVAIPAFLNQKGKANDANVKADISSAQTAEETFFTNGQLYSSTNSDLTSIESSLTQAFGTVASGGDAMSLAAPAPAVSMGNTNSTSPAPTNANSYVITATSKSTVQYALVHNSDGTLSRVCNVPSGINAGGCKPTTPPSGTGTW